MKLLKFKKTGSNKYKVNIDDITITLYDDVIVKTNLISKKNITKEELDEITKYNDELDAYYKCLNYIKKRLRTEKELRNYLLKYKYNNKLIDETIIKLKDNNFLNSDNYLKSYVNDQINLTNNGPYKIKNNLVNLGFTEIEILKYLDFDDSIWQDKIKKLINKKSINHKYSQNKLKNKIIIDLVNMGYEKDLILSNIDLLNMEDDIDLLQKTAEKYYLKLAKKYDQTKLKYYLINKLLNDGFSYDKINEVIENLGK